jgi:hypothetical protein
MCFTFGSFIPAVGSSSIHFRPGEFEKLPKPLDLLAARIRLVLPRFHESVNRRRVEIDDELQLFVLRKLHKLPLQNFMFVLRRRRQVPHRKICGKRFLRIRDGHRTRGHRGGRGRSTAFLHFPH